MSRVRRATAEQLHEARLLEDLEEYERLLPAHVGARLGNGGSLYGQLFFGKTDQEQVSGSRGRYARTQKLADTIVDVVNREFAELPLSTRQVYYQCVSRGAVANATNEYRRVQRLLVELRREREIDFARIVDRTRSVHRLAAWSSARELLRQAAQQFRLDLWAEQPTIVMVACEKQALEGIFAEAVDEWGAPLFVIRGYGSDSYEYEWSVQIREYVAHGKRVAVYYFGDHDPSGLNIEQTSRRKLAAHLEREDIVFDDVATWERRGLLLDDFARFGLVNVPVKRTDSRAKAYLATYGDRAAELDALKPDELRQRIREAIVEHVDVQAWERLRKQEAAQQESLDHYVANWSTALATAGGAG